MRAIRIQWTSNHYVASLVAALMLSLVCGSAVAQGWSQEAGARTHDRSSIETSVRQQAEDAWTSSLLDSSDGFITLSAQPSPQGVQASPLISSGEDVDADGGPNIEDPGPDSPDFPDSAFTVPPGVVYFETSLTYASVKGPRVRDYFTDTLIRVGLWEDWELRISSPGIIHEDGLTDDTTGFGPLTFGFKRHIWDEIEGWGIPAFGIIAQVTTPTASAGFDNGAGEPTIFFNFDHTLPCDFAFEWNAGMSWLKGDDGERFFQGEILWALGRELTPNLEGFVHGIVDVPSASGEQETVVVGPGILWVVTDRMALDSSYNFGLTPESPHRIIRLGLSMAL